MLSVFSSTMAAIKCCALVSLFFVSVVLPQCLCEDNGYYAYTVGRRKPFSTEEIRIKRYVESVIPRLADNFHANSLISKDFGKDDGVGGTRGSKEVFLGNVPIKESALLRDMAPIPETPKPNTTPVPSAPSVPDVHQNVPPKPAESNNSVPKPEIPEHKEEQGDKSKVNMSTNTATERGTDYMATDDYPKDISNNNNTLLKNNITNKQTDQHTYYNSTMTTDEKIGKQYWVDMNSEKEVVVNDMLSNSHRRAVTVKLKFDFPFYGHTIRNISIATGGFLYTGDYIHSWLAATQYIAPLMANFDTNISAHSLVRYRDNGTAFTVEWDNVRLQDKDSGEFTFQATLLHTGDIIFVYKTIPISVTHIEDSLHPVKVGLSDAYIIDRTVFFVRRKTIYEYHRVNFKGPEIKNWTVIYMVALPTCHSLETCEQCVTQLISFDCKWCPSVNRCSTGYDRMRQQWQSAQCETSSLKQGDNCSAARFVIPASNSKQTSSSVSKDVPQVATVVAHSQEASEKAGSFSHTGMMGLLLFILAISGVSLWVLYAYRNPHTQSGQVLIKYRPSQWGLRRGEARYTAASIHM